MAIETQERDLQASYFRAKLAAEKQKADAVRKVKEGKGEFVFLDARDPSSFDKGHIPGAQSMPLDALATASKSLDVNREYVVYCWNAH